MVCFSLNLLVPLSIILRVDGLLGDMAGTVFLGAGQARATSAGCHVLDHCGLRPAGWGFSWSVGKLFLGDGCSYFLGVLLVWACVLLVERHAQVSAYAALLLCTHPITEVM